MQIENKFLTPLLTLLVIITGLPVAYAQDADAVAEMARKAQDPLGDVKALMTDNTIGIDAGPNEDTIYGFQLQPVYAVPNETGFNQIARAVIPIVGVEPGVVTPRLGPDPRPVDGDQWGLSDIILLGVVAIVIYALYKTCIDTQVKVFVVLHFDTQVVLFF